jgi:hypothetical protein
MPQSDQSSEAIRRVSQLLSERDHDAAAEVLRREYPFVRRDSVERKYGLTKALGVFLRDGFIDRYSGARLVLPAALRLIAHLLPEEFPYHANWKMSETHIGFWELSPTVDHVVPVCLGGADDPSNWVTTSMLRNSAKGNWRLEELGWSLVPAGDLRKWDGLLGWFGRYVASSPQVLVQVPALRDWQRAVRAVAG